MRRIPLTNWHLATSYRFAGVHSGLRPDPDRLDLALVLSDRPARAAGVFTQNRVAAAPVRVCRERLPRADARGVVICSGNANACTGQCGLDDARRMAALTAQAVDCKPEQILVCSTGVIGRPLPMPQIESGIALAGRQLQADVASFEHAARAILTTDTRVKVSTRRLSVGGGEYRVTGFAKGAAMIGPNMATLLAFVLTDAPVGLEDLTRLVRWCADASFNCLSVEGHTSTNDTLLFFANGQGTPWRGGDLEQFQTAAREVCIDLAREMADDAEGAAHRITIEVDGLRSDAEARQVAKSIADDALVKTAIFGADPNWGRIVSAAGHAGVAFEEKDLSLWLGEYLLYEKGTPLSFDAAAVSATIRSRRDIALRLRFTLGEGRCTFWTCDLTYEYVRLNAEYTT
jgi:glutamate N-acetyltransferase/amino-acid N-acetyltransferase